MERKRYRVTGTRGVDCTSRFTRVAVLGLLTAGLACLSAIGCGSSRPVVPVSDEAEWSDADGIQVTQVRHAREPFESSGDWLVQ